jgi:hypothetical protein
MEQAYRIGPTTLHLAGLHGCAGEVGQNAARRFVERLPRRRRLHVPRLAHQQFHLRVASMSRICRLNADWAINSRSAARLKLPASTISTK